MYHIINIKWCIRNFIENNYREIIMEFEYVNEFYITQFSLDIRRPLLWNLVGHYY